MKNEYHRSGKRQVWLDVWCSFEPPRWLVETIYPPFIKQKEKRQFHEIKGNEIIYMVRGFANNSDARAFAITYHKAKADGLVSRYRLD